MPSGIWLTGRMLPSERSFGATIDELAGVHAFDSDEKLSVLLEFVLVSENDFGKRGATAWVVHNVLDDSLDVTSTLSEVQGSEGRGCDSLRGVGLEDRARTTSLDRKSTRLNSSHR